MLEGYSERQEPEQARLYCQVGERKGEVTLMLTISGSRILSREGKGRVRWP